MNRKLLRKVARKHGVSLREVREEMQIAINHAYKNPTVQAQSVERKDETPTPEELVNHVVRKIKKGTT